MKISESSRVLSKKNNRNNIVKNNPNRKNQNFNGSIATTAFNMLDKGFSVLDKNAMIQVSFVDSVSTNIPRTLVDLKTGLAASLETMRREFSGLIVNCLLPSFVVMGVAKSLPKDKILEGTNPVKSWANSDAINKFKGVFNDAQKSGATDKTKEYVTQALTSLEGLDGKNWVKFSSHASKPEFKEAIDHVTEAIGKTGKERTGLLKKAQTKIVGLTKAESILKFKNQPQANLEETLRDVVDLGSKFNKVKEKTIKAIGNPMDEAAKVEEAVNKYSGSLNKLVNKKSFIGLGAVIALAVSIQSINRAITRKQFKTEGAPIYKDFGKKDTTQKMDENQKKKFFGKKLVSAASMYGLAAASMMKKPSVGMFQFSGIFPTLDQCRWIAASTFASRMMAAEDENELRESTVRDLASFSGLYFLGDYVKKGVASGIEALSKTKKGASLLGENVVLLNRKKEVAKPVLEKTASLGQKVVSQVGFRAKQFGNWIKNTELKSAAEVSSTKVRNMRNICRVADIAFSIVALGILLPKYNRSVTEKKVAEAQKLEAEQKNAAQNFTKVIAQNNTPAIFKELT